MQKMAHILKIANATDEPTPRYKRPYLLLVGFAKVFDRALH